MPAIKKISTLCKGLLTWTLLCFAAGAAAQKPYPVQPISYPDIAIAGELHTRAMKNYDRLESDIYTPENVFPVQHNAVSQGWPGDYEGRIILALTLQAQATHREPAYLAEIIRRFPRKVNAEGYLGPIMKDSVLEQQLSGHGWLLRGLCEYYLWKKDPKVKGYIQNIIEHLALPTAGYHRVYPIDPSARNRTTGEAVGTTESAIGKWKLSSDIGCDFIFMDGVIQAYGIIPSPALRHLIEEMTSRFLQIDLAAISAQTHATLTALRGLLRYQAMVPQPGLLQEVQRRYDLYRTTATTADYENFNWFGRPEWTEPCAIVDAYMIAVQLWSLTRNPTYLEDAHHIYYNAIANTQRANGGFGLSNCPGPKENILKVAPKVSGNEAYWCCTMRGGEGLASAVRYNYFVGAGELVVPFFNSSEATIRTGKHTLVVQQTSRYPFEGTVQFDIRKASTPAEVTLKLAAPSFTGNHRMEVNGRSVPVQQENGFIVFRTRLTTGTVIRLSFDLSVQPAPMVNTKYARPGFYTLNYGPLLLGYAGREEIVFDKKPVVTRISDHDWLVAGRNIHLSPVYQLLNPEVRRETGYSRQILFRIAE